MADRYLLESGAPDGYQLEDASGVLLLEAAATPVSQSTAGVIPRVDTPSIQGGYSTVPNLLLTTLAVFAAGSQLVKREATVHNPKPVPVVQAFQQHNLLTSTLGVQVVAIPPGEQRCDSAPQTPQIGQWHPNRNPLLYTLPIPIGQDRTESAPPSIVIGAAQQTQSRLLLEQVVQPIPPGHQQVDSAPPTPSVLFWDRGSNTLIFTTPPAGHQQVESTPPSQPITQAQETQSRAILDFIVQPIPQGQQETANLIQTPEVWAFNPPQIIPQIVAVEALPIGHQQTDSAPPTPRIGDIKFARGIDPGPPAQANPIPPGESCFLPAPYRNERPQIDQPANLLGSAIGLQPIASANPEWQQRIAPPDVFLWLPENVTIRLPVVAQELPVGEQRTETQVVTPAVYVFIPPQIIPPIVQAIPPGHQQTDSAPIPGPAVQSFAAPVIIPPIVQAIPPGHQQTDSAPIPGPAVQSFTAPVIIPPIVVPIPPGQQRTESAPIPAPEVQSYEAPNATLYIPPPGALPPGQQHTDSAPIWAVPIGMSVGWTIPPDLLPPGVDHPPIPIITEVPAGGSAKKKRRYQIEIDDQIFEVSSKAEAIALLDQVRTLAQENASLAVDRAQKAQKRPKRKVLADARKSLILPTIQADKTLQVLASKATLDIEEMYRDALRIIEIGAYLKKRDDDEDDDISTILILL